jgi:outer membrane lipoprotein-sorting protein
VTMPFRFRFEHPTRGIDTLVRFESIDVNASVPDDAFVQTPRPGLTVQTGECH